MQPKALEKMRLKELFKYCREVRFVLAQLTSFLLSFIDCFGKHYFLTSTLSLFLLSHPLWPLTDFMTVNIITGTKNNPCFIGSPGVGKTAIVEGLAQRIINGDIPTALQDRQLISLDMGALIAGAKFRGEFEELEFDPFSGYVLAMEE